MVKCKPHYGPFGWETYNFIMQEILRFQPLYQERVWGGRAFESAFDRKLTSEKPIGESWEIVDRPEAQSVVKGGLTV